MVPGAGFEEIVDELKPIPGMTETAVQNLIDAGFDARIATGPAPKGFPQANHAWVLVHLDGSRVPVEPTTLTVIREEDPAEYGYRHPESEYSNIWETVRATGNIGEWDWWKTASNDPFR